jgi:hypothetical protein
MSQRNPAVSSPSAIFFKADHPRRIDAAIEYFGGPRPLGAGSHPRRSGLGAAAGTRSAR